MGELTDKVKVCLFFYKMEQKAQNIQYIKRSYITLEDLRYLKYLAFKKYIFTKESILYIKKIVFDCKRDYSILSWRIDRDVTRD